MIETTIDLWKYFAVDNGQPGFFANMAFPNVPTKCAISSDGNYLYYGVIHASHVARIQLVKDSKNVLG